MKAKFAALILGALLVLAVVACGEEVAPAASSGDIGTTDGQATAVVDEHTDDAADRADESPADADSEAVAVIDDHDDEEAEHADEELHADEVEATALAEHDLTPHSEMVGEDHEDEATEAQAHSHAEASVDPDAPVVHFFASEFGYETVTTEIEAGHAFTVQLHNEGVLEHDITFDGFEDQGGIHLQPGEDDLNTFLLSEPGEYTYYCTVPGHREAGMLGTLIVLADDHLVEAAHEDEHADEEAVHEDEHADDAVTHEDEHTADEVAHEDEAHDVDAPHEDEHATAEAVHEDEHATVDEAHADEHAAEDETHEEEHADGQATGA